MQEGDEIGAGGDGGAGGREGGTRGKLRLCKILDKVSQCPHLCRDHVHV